MAQRQAVRDKKGFICDMDGVIYHGNTILPNVLEFVHWLQEENKRFLFLTNGSGRSPKELRQKLQRMGLDVDESHFYTSALATAAFIKSQNPRATAYVIGDPGLMGALYDAGITMDDVSPEYVIVGETSNYNSDSIIKAVLPDPKSLGANYHGQTSIGCRIRGIKDGKERTYYIYNNCDHEQAYRETGTQAVSFTTGVPAALGASMWAKGLWRGAGVFNVEEFDPDPFLAELGQQGLPWHELFDVDIEL